MYKAKDARVKFTQGYLLSKMTLILVDKDVLPVGTNNSTK